MPVSTPVKFPRVDALALRIVTLPFDPTVITPCRLFTGRFALSAPRVMALRESNVVVPSTEMPEVASWLIPLAKLPAVLT